MMMMLWQKEKKKKFKKSFKFIEASEN